MIPVDQAVDVRTLRSFSDSSMSRIAMKMIEEAQASSHRLKPAPQESHKRWYLRCFTLALCFSSSSMAHRYGVRQPVRMDEMAAPLARVLNISCPCALVVSIPLSYFASLGIPLDAASSSRVRNMLTA